MSLENVCCTATATREKDVVHARRERNRGRVKFWRRGTLLTVSLFEASYIPRAKNLRKKNRVFVSPSSLSLHFPLGREYRGAITGNRTERGEDAFPGEKNSFFPLQSDKLTFTISRVFEGGDASPPTEHGEEGTNKNGMDEARVFRFILEKVGNEKERSRVFSIREHRTRYTRRGKRMKMTYSRQVVIRAIFRSTWKISSKYDNFNSAV